MRRVTLDGVGASDGRRVDDLVGRERVRRAERELSGGDVVIARGHGEVPRGHGDAVADRRRARVGALVASGDGNVVEDEVLTATGEVTASDVDDGALLTYSGGDAGDYGTLSVDAKTGEWTYTLDNSRPETQALNDGHRAVELFYYTVTDESGAVLPGVTVEAASPALIEKVRSAVSDDQGNYKIVDLRPGTYTVTLYKHSGLDAQVVSTTRVEVTK